MNQPVTFQVNGTFMAGALLERFARKRLRSVDRYCNTYSIMRRRNALVMGASGFVGSHVTRQLVERGDDVRVLLRETSSTRGIDDLDVQRCFGDIFDGDAVRAAMAGRDDVYYCVVDARAMLPDPAPLIRTNVDGLRHVLDIAADADLLRFVYLSTIGTIAVSSDGSAVTEDTPFNWADKGGPYIAARRTAEDMVLRYVNERALPAVVLNVSTPYGPRDWQPTPHGGLIARAALGTMPFYVKGVTTEVVGVEDAARAAAGRRTRPYRRALHRLRELPQHA